MSFLSILQNDLRSLSLEARKKFPQIKETTERAILKLRNVDEQEHELAKKIEALAKADEVLKPLLLACESNNPKMVALGVGSIQKLIAQNAVSEASLPRIMRVLAQQVETGDDTVKLKILQAVVSLLTTQTNMHGESLSQSLCMCFRLHKNKSVAVKNTASATLRQLVTMLFDRALLEFNNLDGEALDAMARSPSEADKSALGDSNQRMPKNLPPSIQDAHFLLQDLCSLTGGDNPLWLPVQAISKTFGYELIETLLATHQPLFIHIYEFQLLLKDRICPLVIRALGNKASVFTYAVRLLRLVGTFIKNFIDLMKSECEVFLERLVRLMSMETPIWMKALAMEVLKDICSSEKLLRSMYVNYDAKAVATDAADSRLVFEGMVKAIARFVQKLFDVNNKLVMHHEPARTKCIDMLSHREPPATISLSYTLNLGLECLTAIIDAVASLAIQKVKVASSPTLQHEPIRRVLQFDNPFEEDGVTQVEVVAPTAKITPFKRGRNGEDGEEEEEEEEAAEEGQGSNDTESDVAAVDGAGNKKISGKEISKRMAESSWTSILPALTLMLTKAGDEGIVEGILRAYQLFIHICGSNELTAPRDAFLTSLCHFAIPTSTVSLTADATDDASGEPAAPRTVKVHVFEGTLSAKNVLALRTLMSLAHGMGGILGTAWPLVLQTLETLNSVLHPATAAKSPTGDAPNPALDKKGSGSALPGMGGTGNGGLGPSSSSVKTAEESGLSRGIDRLPSPREISFMSTSLESVFEGTKYLDDASLAHFLSALASLSSNALLACEVKRPAATSSADTPTPANHPSPMFALSKLVETTLLNIERIDKTWPIVSAHLSAVSNHKVASVRSYGVESLAKIMETSLTRLPAIPRRSRSVPSFQSKAQISQILYDMSAAPPTVGTPLDQSPAPALPIRSPAPSPAPKVTSVTAAATGSSAGGATPGRTSPSSLRRRARRSVEAGSTVAATAEAVPDLQIEFLTLLDNLAQSKHTDTRSKTMQALFALLQSSGQSLSTGWPVVLAIINRGNNDKQLIQVAFRCLGFICSDFLTNLPIECVEQVIAAIGKFGRQTAFMNISLTAVGLLWNIADFLATESKALRKQLAEAVEKEAELIMGSWLMNSNTSNKLWLSTYHELKQLCTDARTEVRNCAIQTLFKTLATHGSLLEHDTWPHVIDQVLFPLMNEIRQSSATAGKSRIDTELGKEGGKSVIMMVHHTRNTEEKQWNETQVLALQGIVQVFRTYFPTLSALPNFAASWHALLVLFHAAATAHSSEVSACAIQSLRELMHPHAADDKFGRLLWEDMWTALEQIGDYLVRTHPRDLPYTDVPQQSLLELVRTVGHIHSKFRAACTTADIRRLLTILEPLPLYPGEDVRRVSPLQKKVLKVIDKLSPLEEQELYLLVFKQLLHYVSVAINYPLEPTSSTAASPAATTNNAAATANRKFHPLGMKAIDLIVRFVEAAPAVVVTQIFEQLIMVLGAGMMIKYVNYASPLWRTAVRGFAQAVGHALPLFARAPDLGEEQERRVWTQLYACLQEFLFHDRALLPPLGLEEMQEDEALDIALADLLALRMLRCAAGVPFLHARLLSLLQEGSVFHSVPVNQRETFAEGCYANLCRLCAHAADPDDGYSCNGRVGRLAYPLVMARARAVLRRFVEDDSLAGARPLPRHQLAEVSALLRQLHDLRLPPSLPLPETEAEDASPEATREWRPREHLLRLYPQLCECITTREDQMKPLLRQLFSVIGQEMGLVSSLS